MTEHTQALITPLATMLEMQDAMNKKVHPDWFKKNFEWYRAIWIECGEMLDHYGWKWWKHQSPDLEQVKLELVDIFHFGLSCRINGVDDYTVIAAQLAEEMSQAKQGANFPETLEMLAASALTMHGFDAQAFIGCMRQIDMDFAELYRSYVGKNTLNFFRQDHGYKDGSYIKVWHGKEDNEHLIEVLNELDITDPEFRQQVYLGLKSRYPQ
ncbi:dUTP diphosphatase [Pleionea mediterranea]|uniref:Dimeric dUTPase (All-alpha-NTP-PPase superfamily) n=1 Tax=Pleionea mediterranea TaxID=523701 RepID=A0A316FZI6_9GAMM|nr:dUTP diphosphatase [Pleionea mediterranea]PWK53823.1 dimeric dUTPase (all-alpha-NTP-PPase superfamily) [Pleionea mediterranea]